ncbi:hypothetical protein ACN47E_000535 [Coniothyrium glycines]
MHPAKVQRWAGLTRTVSDWNLLRRDPELWYEDGDCFIHLHAKGASRRGPSFCIPYRALRQKECSAMLSLCEAQTTAPTGLESYPHRRMPSSLKDGAGSNTVQIFIPAPDETSREDSFRWHITTRNLFAFLLGRPMVGEHMGQSFVDLQERLVAYRPEHANNHQGFLDYAESQGYRDLVECTDYALASLFYAEHYKLRDVWIDAFAHCVGMNDSLALSPEYALNSRLTKALITRASLEVDMHLGRVANALSTFLEDDLSATHLGLADGARAHLNRFRRFLHIFYSEKFGYWPPRRGAAFPKALYKSMFYDFQTLYDYLADKETTTDIASQKPASGGICVLQNVANFDKRHSFKAQANPLPLLPNYVPFSKRLDSPKALRQMTLASQHNKTHNLHSMSAALVVATNTVAKSVAHSKIVQAYMDFERSHAINAAQREEKISVIDARKVRWLLIYGTLQYLISALRAPKEVRDYESADYPLCCMAEQSTWGGGSHEATLLPTPSAMLPPATNVVSSESQQSTVFSIEPDCHREDYFSQKAPSRCGSVECPAPLKVVPPVRHSSLRAFAPHSVSVRSPKNTLKKYPTLEPDPHNTILANRNGDGLNEPIATPSLPGKARPISLVHSVLEGIGPESSWLRSRTPSVRASAAHSRQQSTDLDPRTPTLDTFQFENSFNLATPRVTNETPSRSDSTGSTNSAWSEGVSVASSKTSAGSAYIPCKAGSVESSGLLGGLVSVPFSATDSSSALPTPQEMVAQSHIHPLLREPSPPTGFDFRFDAQQSGPSNAHSETSQPGSAIGMAFSGPPSPPISDKPMTISRADAAALMTEKRLHSLSRNINAECPSTGPSVSTKKDRDSHVFPDLDAPSSEQWEHYRNSLLRRESPTMSSSRNATPPPISKTAHNFRVPSFRSLSRASSVADGEKEKKKKEKRFSSFWKR